jgi:hypothetical protein
MFFFLKTVDYFEEELFGLDGKVPLLGRIDYLVIKGTVVFYWLAKRLVECAHCLLPC